jgi:hypothetical protein
MPITPLYRRSWFLWTAASLLTLASAIYQRRTGPTYPLSGKAVVGGAAVAYKLERTHAGSDAHPVRIAAPEGVTGWLSWRKLGDPGAWERVPFLRQGGELTASLPGQPKAGKLEYRVALQKDDEIVWLNGSRAVPIRFKGEVPLWVLLPHVAGMFAGMLISTRAGLSGLLGVETRTLVLLAVAILTVGGMMLGPLLQWYAFDEPWTGWPVSTDLTDNKTAVAWLIWVIAAWRGGSRWAAAAGIVTMAVFMIPHSVLSGNTVR